MMNGRGGGGGVRYRSTTNTTSSTSKMMMSGVEHKKRSTSPDCDRSCSSTSSSSCSSSCGGDGNDDSFHCVVSSSPNGAKLGYHEASNGHNGILSHSSMGLVARRTTASGNTISPTKSITPRRNNKTNSSSYRHHQGKRKNSASHKKFSWKRVCQTMPIYMWIVLIFLSMILLGLIKTVVQRQPFLRMAKRQGNAFEESISIATNEKGVIHGLWDPPKRPFVKVPFPHLQKVVCLSSKQKGMGRAFEGRGWKVIWLGSQGGRKNTVEQDTDLCAKEGWAHVIWTKGRHKSLKIQQPWQRYSWIPHQNIMSGKASLLKALQEYVVAKRHAEEKYRLVEDTADDNAVDVSSPLLATSIPFLPETFTLPKDRDALVHRLSYNNSEGLNEPWVIKLAATDNGMGIAIVGPGSNELHKLQTLVSSNTDTADVMPEIRNQLVHVQPNDQRDPKSVQKARERSLKQNDDIIVQRYVCNELSFQGHKFDLRIYYLIASVDPLVVFYHDGFLRVALGNYNSNNFTSTHDHLTNLGQNRGSEDASASFEMWDVALKEHVNHPSNRDRFTEDIRNNPLDYVRCQIKSALAQIIASVRHRSFTGYPQRQKISNLKTSTKKKLSSKAHTTMENGFALMGGDFIIDQDLRIYMTEAQSSPGLSDTLKIKQALNDRLLYNKVGILEKVFELQEKQQPLFPTLLEPSVRGDYELIYTDDFQFKCNRYGDLSKRSQLQRGPCRPEPSSKGAKTVVEDK